MTLFAHVAGVPVEEAVLSLSSAGAAVLAARTWLALHWRRRARRGEPPASDRADAAT
jgi:hypothetical protein